MQLLTQVELSGLNTFGVAATASSMVSITHRDQVARLSELTDRYQQHLVLGSGSNLLFIEPIPHLICKMDLTGLRYHDEGHDSILLTAAAGESWHKLVMQTLDDGYSGFENLALIPGTVGAAPVQNIGAYGVELNERLERVEALDLQTNKVINFSNDECQFSYRDSYFKQNMGRYIIISVTFRLYKTPRLVLGYQPLMEAFAGQAVENISAKQVAAAVIKVRQQKLPDPEQLGNAGSFFKNPVISIEQLDLLKTKFPNAIAHEIGSGKAKIAAGWLIDNLGYKGFRNGDAGVHEHQALVLVNYGTATGEQLFNLSEEIKASVFDTYGVNLEREVRIIGGATC